MKKNPVVISHFNICANRLYQNRLRDKGVVDMLPGLYEAKALKQLRYDSSNQYNSVAVVSVHV